MPHTVRILTSRKTTVVGGERILYANQFNYSSPKRTGHGPNRENVKDRTDFRRGFLETGDNVGGN